MSTGQAFASAPQPAPLGVVVLRAGCFAALWMVLMPSVKPGDLGVGAFAVAAATWASLRLMAPAAGGLRLGRMLALAPYYLKESVLAGLDVAMRALGPQVRVRPGYVDCPVSFPPGMARNTFASITSLLPGTVPCGDADGMLVYHALDTSQPVVEQLQAEERRLMPALVAGQGHG